MTHRETYALSTIVHDDCAASAAAALPGVCPACGKPIGPGDLRFRVSERTQGMIDEDNFLRISSVIAYCRNCAK